ncbi:hypothetical protein EV121DRAFT_284946 [Schizophyllum commune]
MQDLDNLLAETAALGTLEKLRVPYVPDAADAQILLQQVSDLTELKRELIRKLDAQIDRHRALLAPVRRLPNEILSEIFIYALPDDWSMVPAGTRVLNVTQVSHTWREVAFGTPFLWSSIYVSIDKNPPAKWEAVLRARLERTAQVPLHIRVRMMPHQVRTLNKVVGFWSDEWWNLLCRQAHRWQTAVLDNVPVAAVGGPGGLELTQLHRLDVTVDRRREAADDMDICAKYTRFLQNAPRLREVSFSYFVPVTRVEFPAAWSALTRLDIDGSDTDGDEPSLASCLPAIAACSHTLTFLWLSLHSFGDPGQTQPISFPALEQLKLYYGAIHLCRIASAPHLRMISLSEMPYVSVADGELEAFEMLLERSDGCPRLASFKIDALDEAPERIVRCLRRIPSVTHLYVSNGYLEDAAGPSVTPELVRALTRTGDMGEHDKLLPNLVDLTLHCGLYKPVEEELVDLLRTMCASRRKPRVMPSGETLADLQSVKVLETPDSMIMAPEGT